MFAGICWIRPFAKPITKIRPHCATVRSDRSNVSPPTGSNTTSAPSGARALIASNAPSEGSRTDASAPCGSRNERARRAARVAAGGYQGRCEGNAGAMHPDPHLPGTEHWRRHVLKRELLIRHPVMATHGAHRSLLLVVFVLRQRQSLH